MVFLTNNSKYEKYSLLFLWFYTKRSTIRTTIFFHNSEGRFKFRVLISNLVNPISRICFFNRIFLCGISES